MILVKKDEFYPTLLRAFLRIFQIMIAWNHKNVFCPDRLSKNGSPIEAFQKCLGLSEFRLGTTLVKVAGEGDHHTRPKYSSGCLRMNCWSGYFREFRT